MTSASGLPPSSASNSWLGKVRSKFGHVRDFFASYVSGVKLFGQEVRVATRLAFRVYGQGKRSSRLERLHMRQSFGDLVRVLPLAGLFLVFGLELTTMAILRYMPALLPRAMRLAVVPAAQKLGVAPASNVDASARRRLALCTDLVQGARGGCRRQAERRGGTPGACGRWRRRPACVGVRDSCRGGGLRGRVRTVAG